MLRVIVADITTLSLDAIAPRGRSFSPNAKSSAAARLAKRGSPRAIAFPPAM